MNALTPACVAAWPAQASNQTKVDRITAAGEDNRNSRGCCLRRQARNIAARRRDHRDLPANQIGRQLGQAMTVGGITPELGAASLRNRHQPLTKTHQRGVLDRKSTIS
jgi:hypothetical protein